MYQETLIVIWGIGTSGKKSFEIQFRMKNMDQNILVQTVQCSCCWGLVMLINVCKQSSGGCFNIRTPLYQYRNSCYKHKTVLQLSCLYNGNPCISTWEDCLYIKAGPCICWWGSVSSECGGESVWCICRRRRRPRLRRQRHLQRRRNRPRRQVRLKASLQCSDCLSWLRDCH